MPAGIIRLDEGWTLDASHHLDQPPFVPLVVPVVVARNKKGKSMDYIPSKRANQKQWWTKISTDINTEGPKMTLTAPQIAAAKAVADDQVAKMEATDSAKLALDGARAMEATATPANELAIRGFVRNWKTLPGYAASGSEGVLSLKGTEPAFDPSTFKTVLKITIDGGKPKIGFNKDGVDMVVIYCRLKGTAGWRRLGTDSSSPYYDTEPLANPNLPEVREYMAMGMIDDIEIGLPSDIVSITLS
jgi:hypothetical protein